MACVKTGSSSGCCEDVNGKMWDQHASAIKMGVKPTISPIFSHKKEPLQHYSAL